MKNAVSQKTLAESRVRLRTPRNISAGDDRRAATLGALCWPTVCFAAHAQTSMGDPAVAELSVVKTTTGASPVALVPISGATEAYNPVLSRA